MSDDNKGSSNEKKYPLDDKGQIETLEEAWKDFNAQALGGDGDTVDKIIFFAGAIGYEVSLKNIIKNSSSFDDPTGAYFQRMRELQDELNSIPVMFLTAGMQELGEALEARKVARAAMRERGVRH